MIAGINTPNTATRGRRRAQFVPVTLAVKVFILWVCVVRASPNNYFWTKTIFVLSISPAGLSRHQNVIFEGQGYR